MNHGMNSEKTAAALRGVVARVLEDASFVFTDELDPATAFAEKPSAETPEAIAWDAMGVALTFGGAKTGAFRLWADSPFAGLLAANMLGLDMSDDCGPEKRLDALKETANIIVGNALTEIFGDTVVFELGIPQQADRALLAADSSRSDAVWLQAEGYRVLCVLAINEA